MGFNVEVHPQRRKCQNGPWINPSCIVPKTDGDVAQNHCNMVIHFPAPRLIKGPEHNAHGCQHMFRFARTHSSEHRLKIARVRWLAAEWSSMAAPAPCTHGPHTVRACPIQQHHSNKPVGEPVGRAEATGWAIHHTKEGGAGGPSRAPAQCNSPIQRAGASVASHKCGYRSEIRVGYEAPFLASPPPPPAPPPPTGRRRISIDGLRRTKPRAPKGSREGGTLIPQQRSLKRSPQRTGPSWEMAFKKRPPEPLCGRPCEPSPPYGPNALSERPRMGIS